MSEPAAEKTEEATSRRREKEREKGNIPKSQDLNSALILTAGVAILGVLASSMLTDIQNLIYTTLTHLNPKEISDSDILLIIMPFVRASVRLVLPFLVILTISAAVIIRMQVGHVFSPEKIKFDLQNLAPSKILKATKKMFNPADPKNVVELVKSLIKLLIVAACGFSVVNARKNELFALFGMNVVSSFSVVASILGQMLLNMCLAMLVIGLLDKKFQTYEYEKSIKMTKQEIKDEHKDTEGDPKIKARIRSMQMKMAHNKMMSSIQNADVVVTNPTHYAIALEYNKLKNPAPRVIAKGVDFVAFKIREVAQNNNIPIVENPPLARALYKLVPIDGIIPSDMFVAVAEVLAYIYNRDKQGG